MLISIKMNKDLEKMSLHDESTNGFWDSSENNKTIRTTVQGRYDNCHAMVIGVAESYETLTEVLNIVKEDNTCSESAVNHMQSMADQIKPMYDAYCKMMEAKKDE